MVHIGKSKYHNEKDIKNIIHLFLLSSRHKQESLYITAF